MKRDHNNLRARSQAIILPGTETIARSENKLVNEKSRVVDELCDLHMDFLSEV